MFDLNSISVEKTVSPYINYGARQELFINGIELVKSSTGSQKAVLHMETRPVSDADFKPIEGHVGKVGKINAGVYMKTHAQQEEFLGKMIQIAKCLGLEEDARLIKGDTFEEIVSKLQSVVSGKNKYARYTIYGEQYQKQNEKTGLRLFLPRWSFVEALSVPEEDSKLAKFDENDPHHFKRVANQKPYGMPKEDIVSDLPF